MWDYIVRFFTSAPIWELALILVSKIIEVTMETLRIILVNKGYRKQGAIIAFFELLLWVFIASRVITGITAAPLKGVVYSLGYAIGVYLGSRLESRIAIGKILVQTITSEEIGAVMAQTLRQKGYGVTTIRAKGKDSNKMVLMIFANRRGKEEIIRSIQKIDADAMIETNDVSTLHGGYISPLKHILK
jgi:uncharacterized protein YebE (UPF0316 family)